MTAESLINQYIVSLSDDSLNKVEAKSLARTFVKENADNNSKRTFDFSRLAPMVGTGDLGVFAPLKDEPFWPGEKAPFSVALVLTNDKNLNFRAIINWDDFYDKAQSFQVSLEDKDHEGSTYLGSLVKPSALLIPGVLFDREGRRLGRGKGFYDRYLEDYSGVKIGICFSERVCDSLAHLNEEHDESVDYILTENELIQI